MKNSNCTEEPYPELFRTMRGDLITFADQGYFDVIIHGCNCFHIMGAGIAKQIKQRWPEAFVTDKLQTVYGDKSKLGRYSVTRTLNSQGKELIIVNAYTQYNPGRDVSYQAIKDVFERIKKDFHGKRIGYPAIGCGIAGGDWSLVEKIIGKALAGEEHFFVKYCP